MTIKHNKTPSNFQNAFLSMSNSSRRVFIIPDFHAISSSQNHHYSFRSFCTEKGEHSRHCRSSCKALSFVCGNWRALPPSSRKPRYRHIPRPCPCSLASTARTSPEIDLFDARCHSTDKFGNDEMTCARMFRKFVWHVRRSRATRFYRKTREIQIHSETLEIQKITLVNLFSRGSSL